MKASLMLLTSSIVLLITTSLALADIPPGPDEHLVTRCLKIVNLDEFPDIVLVAQDLYVGNQGVVGSYLVNSNECLHMSYKFNSLEVYAVDKEYFESKGINNINYSSDNNSLASSTDLSPHNQAVPNTNPLIYEFIDYSIAGFSGDNLIVYMSRKLSVYNNNLPNISSRYDPPNITDLRLTLHENDTLNPIPGPYDGYVIENNQCVYKIQPNPIPDPKYDSLDECELHLQACTTQYDPVCGVDNKTYSNSCFAGVANVTISCRGTCPCLTETPPAKNFLVVFFESIRCFFQHLIEAFSFWIIRFPEC